VVPASCGLSAGSYAAPRQRLARRIAGWTAWCTRRLAWWWMRFETDPVACQMAHSYIASADGSRRGHCLAQQLARGASTEDSIRDGPGVLPNGSLAALRRGIRIETGPTSCLTARSRRFGGWFEVRRHFARRLARGASADGSVETGPVSCPAVRATTALQER